MFQDNPLLNQLKQQIQETLPKKEGTIKANDKGFGFLELDNKKSSIFIPPPYMKKVMHGDHVEAVVRTENERESAEPQKLLEPALERFVGRIKKNGKRLSVIPDRPQLKNPINAKVAKALESETFENGDWIVANLTRHPLKGDNNFFCEIVTKIAESEAPVAPWWVTLAHNDLPNTEPDGIEHWDMHHEELNREDLTHLPFITIDGESTKDMDDALYAVANTDGTFTLTVAIADPTAYITPDDDLDKEARSRGFTIYLPGRNIPMLPRELADDLCSLHEGEKRPALCSEITLEADGTIKEYRFFAAYIQSHARLSYNQISDFLEDVTDCWTPESDSIKDQILALYEVSKARASWRETYAVTFPDRPDYKFELGENSEVLAIHIEERRTANRIVEEAMITANVCAGRLLKEKFNNGVFNTHAGFAQEKLGDIMDILKEAEAPFTQEEITSIEGFSALRRWLNAKPTIYWDSRLRRLQSYSETSTTPAEHYAMGLDAYATWTSPIRKYGDMVNHRLLKAAITGAKPVQIADEELGEELGQHKRFHRMAERTIGDWLYTMLLAADVEKETEFKAEIFDINRAGMRVRLLENGAAAFIPGKLIMDNKERIECSQEKGTISIDGNVEYKLGDETTVVIAEAKIATRSLIAKPKAK